MQKWHSGFEDFNVCEENEDNRFTRYAIIGCIGEYFGNLISEQENVSNEL